MSSISDLSGECDVCKRFLEIDYGVYALHHRVVMMTEDATKQMEHMRSSHRSKPRKQYAFTFTTNKTKEEIEQEMCDSAHKLFVQKTVPVRAGEAYLEYTEEGRPHIHGWYETQDGGRIFAKTFRRCWQYWGEKDKRTKFSGVYHEEMKTNRYKGYASAEGRLIVMKKEDADKIEYFYEGV